MKPFVHLHVHSHYSLLDGLSSPSALARSAHAKGMFALALTDHGTMGGIFKFEQACLREGVKPLLGCEMYFVDDVEDHGGRKSNHLTVIARNARGWRNLCRLTTASYVRGHHYVPRIDWKMLERWHEGLITLGGCIQGRIPASLRDGDRKGAKRYLDRMTELLPGAFFVEFMPLGFREQVELNDVIWKFIESEDRALAVVTNDAHYLNREDRDLYPLLMLAQTQGRIQSEVSHAWLKTRRELCETMAVVYPHIPRPFFSEAMDRTVEIAESVTDFRIDTSNKYPEFK